MLHDGSDGDARVMSELPAGSLVVVLASAGARRKVLGPGDIFGYIDAGAAMESLQLGTRAGDTGGGEDAAPERQPRTAVSRIMGPAGDEGVQRTLGARGTVRLGVLLLGLFLAFQLLAMLSEWFDGLLGGIPCIGIC